MHRLQATLDALTTCIAVTDEYGNILLVNRAWAFCKEAHGNSPLHFGVGDNFFIACDFISQAMETPDSNSLSVAEGTREVMTGQRDSFGMEYSWATPQAQQWFNLCVTRFEEEGLMRLVIAQDDITARKRTQAQRHQSEALLHLATESGSVGLWEWDVVTNTQNWNSELKAIFGLPPDVTGLTTQSYLKAIHPEDVVETEQIFRAALEQKLEYEHTYRIVRPDGSVRWITARGRGDYNEAGHPVYMRGSAIDVTQAKQVEEALRESEARFRNSFTSAAIGKALVGLDGRCLRVNRALCDLLGYEEEELLQLTFYDISHPEDLEIDMALFQELVEGTRDSYQLEKRYFHKAGRTIWALLSVSVVRDGQRQLVHCVSEVVDLTLQKQDLQHLQQANAHLEWLAHNDALTGLKNRRSFDERLNQEVAAAKRGGPVFSVLLLDLDHFKRLNDSFGHVAGDEVLRAVASIVTQAMRPSDFVARYGGEEFALILPRTDVAGSLHAAERVRRAISEHSWQPCPVTASIGIATWKGEDAQTLLVKADIALYAAKGAGRNRVYHETTSSPYR